MILSGYAIEAVTANGIAVVILCCLITNLFPKLKFLEYDSRLLFWMMIWNLELALVEPITIVIDGQVFPGAAVIALVLNSILYISNISFAATWTRYAYIRGYGKEALEKNKRYRVLLMIPVFLVYLAVVINFFIPIMFQISPDTLLYERKWGFIIAYIFTYLYLCTGAVITYRSRSRVDRYLLGSAVRFLGPVFIGSVVQFLVNGISLLWIGAAIGLMHAYINIQDEGALIDVLSGLYTRPYINNYISSHLTWKREKKMAGIMIDIDRFKSINDNYGHQTGDAAIRNVGKILRTCVKGNAFAARFAGDEFIVLAAVRNEKEILDLVDAINQAVEKFNQEKTDPYELSFSIGYTLCREGDNLDSFIDRMDTEMYKQKKARKAAYIKM